MMNPFPDPSRKDQRLEAVRAILRTHSPLLIAYSGGVDSATLLAIALRTADVKAEAILADSPSLPRAALQRAVQVAQQLRASLRIVKTRELDDANYAQNPPNRCYFCKAELFRQMEQIARAEGFHALAYGENADDLAADRPGSRAAAEFSVLAPLRQAGMGKAEVRALAKEFGLPVAEAPAQPCLSSRIRHGVPVTAEALALIEKSEEFLADCGFRIYRVRHLGIAEEDAAAGRYRPRAMVQVAPSELEQLRKRQAEISSRLQQLGFGSVEFDPQGYRGPSLA